MLTRAHQLPILVAACVLLCSAATVIQGQTSLAELQNLLEQKAAFNETDFAALQRGETIVKPAPVLDKREVAVSGLVSLHASADEFLRSYRESLTHKNNAAVLEAGQFGAQPALGYLQNLTLEAQDTEDRKECVAGD